MNIKIETIPNKGENIEINQKIEAIVRDRNPIIAKRFNIEELDLTVKLYCSKGELAFKLDPNGEHSVFSGYVDGSEEILLFHPANAGPIFGENIYREMGILIDYSLTKMYLCKKYFPNRSDFKMYHKYISDTLAKISSGSFSAPIAKFDIKSYSEDKRFKKDQEIIMVFYIMLEKSGLDFIYEHLDEIMKDLDIKKTVFTIYKKSFSDLISQIQRELEQEEKKLLKTFRPGRTR